MDSTFFARKEEKAIGTVSQYSWTHMSRPPIPTQGVRAYCSKAAKKVDHPKIRIPKLCNLSFKSLKRWLAIHTPFLRQKA